MVNVSTIQVSTELKNVLEKRKMSSESYEDVIWDVLEDTMVLSDETKNKIAQTPTKTKLLKRLFL